MVKLNINLNAFTTNQIWMLFYSPQKRMFIFSMVRCKQYFCELTY